MITSSHSKILKWFLNNQRKFKLSFMMDSHFLKCNNPWMVNVCGHFWFTKYAFPNHSEETGAYCVVFCMQQEFRDCV